MRLLIAEDDGVSRRILEKVLSKSGHDVVVAADGEEAWRIMQSDDAPSLAVLDWMMPGLDGLDVCRKVRQLQRDVRPCIILLTGRHQKKDLVQGFDAGADDYVTKPFDAEELNARIKAGERLLTLQQELLAAREALRQQATHDAMTGLPNREAIMDLLVREFDRAMRTGESVSVVIADLDHFKKINDQYGHAAGDDVLVEAATRMRCNVRSYENIGRYGGEEFLVVLSSCDLAGAGKHADRIRQAVEAEPFPAGNQDIRVTVSLGAACSSQLVDPDREQLIKMADAALYRAKRAGRNRVELASGLLSDCDRDAVTAMPADGATI